jgi:hypothetical protein
VRIPASPSHKEVIVSRGTGSAARPNSGAEVNERISTSAALATTGPKLPIAVEFDPPVAAAELPPLDSARRTRRRAAK